jgi:isoleucyl-tRNA synthetase
VVLSTELTPALLEEGKYRELLNRIQTFRKDLGLEYSQRIRLAIRGSESLVKIVEARREDLMKETLCVELSASLEGHTREVDIEGEPLTIVLAKA